MLLAIASISVAALVAACTGDRASTADTGRANDSAAATTAGVNSGAPCAGDNAGLKLADGFCAGVYAEGVPHARHVAVASNGDVYVTMEGTTPPGETGNDASKRPEASFVAMRDTNRDGRMDLVQKIGTIGNTGIAIANGFLYVDEGQRIVRYQRSDTALVPEGKSEVIVDALPMSPGHRARNIAIASDGSLYVNVGSATNSCQQKDRVGESPGVDPCTELNTRAGVWKFDAAKANQRFASGARYATGIRNGTGMTVSPDGKLYVATHGRDQLKDNWPKIFDSYGYQAENPLEELIVVNQGDDFGWPYCYYSKDEKKLVDAPEYGGDGKKTARCASKKVPLATFPAHWAPMAIAFHNGQGNVPAKYRDGVFVTFHGSWNRAPEEQSGYNVVFQPMKNGVPDGDYETFADGFAERTGKELQPDRAVHRPVGIAVAADGTIYVTDDVGGRVYRIRYGGAK